MNVLQARPLKLCWPIIVSTVAGCATHSQYPVSSADRPGERVESAQPAVTDTAIIGQRIAAAALDVLGADYRFGGTRPETGFDCSGLAFYSYEQAGLAIPRRSQDQFKVARKVSVRDLMKGDLIFFQDQEKLSHVGIYVGDQMFVHAPSTGKSVSIASLSSPYYQRHLVAAGRLLREGE